MDNSEFEQAIFGLTDRLVTSFKLSKGCMKICDIGHETAGKIGEPEINCFKGCVELYKQIETSYKKDFMNFYVETHELFHERFNKE